MSSWRKAKSLNIPFYDVTVKSGDKIFAPSWDILMKYKSNDNILERESVYIEAFTKHMRESYKNNKQYWIDFLSQEEVAIACYCKAGSFCHRKLLVNMFEKVCRIHNIDFEYIGELA
jgi:uncharacterized protein YeaO (DUF488 family)